MKQMVKVISSLFFFSCKQFWAKFK